MVSRLDKNNYQFTDAPFKGFLANLENNSIAYNNVTAYYDKIVVYLEKFIFTINGKEISKEIVDLTDDEYEESFTQKVENMFIFPEDGYFVVAKNKITSQETVYAFNKDNVGITNNEGHRTFRIIPSLGCEISAMHAENKEGHKFLFLSDIKKSKYKLLIGTQDDRPYINLYCVAAENIDGKSLFSLAHRYSSRDIILTSDKCSFIAVDNKNTFTYTSQLEITTNDHDVSVNVKYISSMTTRRNPIISFFIPSTKETVIRNLLPNAKDAGSIQDLVINLADYWSRTPTEGEKEFLG
jgi:hypothetical protein